MIVEFSFENQIVTEDFGYKQWDTTVICKVPDMGYVITYNGKHSSKDESMRLAFQAFLDNDLYSKDFFGFPDVPTNRKKIEVKVSHLPKEYQDLIWQLIDLKFGKDRVAKIC